MADEPETPTQDSVDLDALQGELEAANNQIRNLTTEIEGLRTSNNQWAKKSDEWVAQETSYKDALAERESLKHERDSLKSQLDQANASLESTQKTLLDNRRNSIREKYSLPEGHTDSMDSHDLDVLENTLSVIKPPESKTVSGAGLDLGSTPAAPNPENLSDMDRALKAIEQAKKHSVRSG